MIRIRPIYGLLAAAGLALAGSAYADNVGQYAVGTSFTVGGSPTAQLFYYDATSGSLRHAFGNGSSWSYETLDGPGSTYSGATTDNVGQGVAVTVFTDPSSGATSIHVFYYDATNQALRHAYYSTTGGWNFEQLDGGAAGGTPKSGYYGNVGQFPQVIYYTGGSPAGLEVSYHDATTGQLREAWYTTTGGWNYQAIDGGGVNNSDNTGQYNASTQLGSGLEIMHYDATKGGVRDTWWGGSSWGHQLLDGGSGSTSGYTGNVGQGIANTPYSSTVLSVFAYDSSHQALRKIWWSGSAWSFGQLDGGAAGGVPTSGYYGNVGQYPAALKYSGVLHVFYYDATNEALRHAQYNGTSWSFQQLDGGATGGSSVSGSDANLGQYNSVFGFNGDLVVLSYDATGGALRVDMYNGSSWSFADID